MTIYKKYKELGISDKEKFTDEEYAAMPDISVLYPLWKEYNNLTSQKTGKENQLAAAETRNSDLPDNSERIAELAAFIAAIEGASLLEQIQLKATKAEYEAEKERLEAEEVATDLVPIQADIDSLTASIATKTAEITNECARLGIEVII